MKIVILCTLLYTLNVMATIPENKLLGPGYLVKTNFSYYSKHQLRAKSINEYFLSSNDQNWIPLGKPENGLLIVGQIEKIKEEKIKLKYRILDSENPQIIVEESSLEGKILNNLVRNKNQSNGDHYKIETIITKIK